ncbi:hypothetical protein Tco_1548265 [Tanacetum coccineum]
MLAELSRRERDANIRPDPHLDIFMKALRPTVKKKVSSQTILKLLGLHICLSDGVRTHRRTSSASTDSGFQAATALDSKINGTLPYFNSDKLTLCIAYLLQLMAILSTSMLAELSRRERDANIKPDPDLDIFMKAASTSGQEESADTDYTQGLSDGVRTHRRTSSASTTQAFKHVKPRLHGKIKCFSISLKQKSQPQISLSLNDSTASHSSSPSSVRGGVIDNNDVDGKIVDKARDDGPPSQSLNQLQEIGNEKKYAGDPNDILREKAKLAPNEVLNAMKVHLKTLENQAHESIHFGRRIQEKKRFLAKDKEVRRTCYIVRCTFP